MTDKEQTSFVQHISNSFSRLDSPNFVRHYQMSTEIGEGQSYQLMGKSKSRQVLERALMIRQD